MPFGISIADPKTAVRCSRRHWPLSTSSRPVSSCFDPTLGKPDRPDQALLSTTGDGANAFDQRWHSAALRVAQPPDEASAGTALPASP